MNPYKVLGINKKATQDEIKKAFNELIKKYHPDKQTEDSDSSKFDEVKKAYDVLKNSKSRKFFDKRLSINNPLDNFVMPDIQAEAEKKVSKAYSNYMKQRVEGSRVPNKIISEFSEQFNFFKELLGGDFQNINKNISITMKHLKIYRKLLQKTYKANKSNESDVLENTVLLAISDLQVNLFNYRIDKKILKECSKIMLGYDPEKDEVVKRLAGYSPSQNNSNEYYEFI